MAALPSIAQMKARCTGYHVLVLLEVRNGECRPSGTSSTAARALSTARSTVYRWGCVERGEMIRDEGLITRYPTKLTKRGIDLLAMLGHDTKMPPEPQADQMQQVHVKSVPHHPLSNHALDVLMEISARPIPRQEINPGVADRLEREALIEVIQLPSPYKGQGKKIRYIQFSQITDAGRARIAERQIA